MWSRTCTLKPALSLVEEVIPAPAVDVRPSQAQKRTHNCLHVLQSNFGATSKHSLDVFALYDVWFVHI